MSNRRMTLRALTLSRLLAAAGCVSGLLMSGAAFAQSAVCRQLESELASLGRTSVQAGRSATSERAQLARVQGSIASLGCNQPTFIFGPQPPAQCGGLKAQAAGLSARIAQVEAPRQVASGGDSRRRMQILAALDSYNCRGGGRQVAAAQQAAPQPQRERSFFDVIFGRNQQSDQPRYATPQDGNLPPLVDGRPVDEQGIDPNAKKFTGGGNLAICVRTCDGFFFPVNYEGTGANDQYEEVCQASCPAAQTEVYWMPAGLDLDRAANEEGVNYTALPNAFKYRQSYDPACTCKQPGQSWAQALKQADLLVGERKNDITVTSESSNRMAQPQDLRGVRAGKRGQTTASLPDDKANITLAPTANDTSGGKRLVSQQQGEMREVSGKDGEKKQVRVVAPALAPGQ